MEIVINNSLKLDSITSPKETHEKIVEISIKTVLKKPKYDNAKHRKNNSVNFFEAPLISEEINLNQILKLNKPKRYYHSQ